MKTGMKDQGNLSSAVGLAEKCRTAPANTMHMPPPSGPKAEPVRTNGVPSISDKGVSK